MKKLVLLIISFFIFIPVINAEEESPSSFIADLIIQNGDISPAFDKNVNEYTVHVDEECYALSIDYMLEDPYASLIIYGNDYLYLGQNKVILKVISSDDSTISTYTFLVTKKEGSTTVFDENSEGVFLEIPITSNTEEFSSYSAQIIASICFVLILFFYYFLFGRGRLKQRAKNRDIQMQK